MKDLEHKLSKVSLLSGLKNVIYIGLNAHVTLKNNEQNVKIELELKNRICNVSVFVIVFVSLVLSLSYF